MTGDEYIALLLERQAAYERDHQPAIPRQPWARPLLEWFIRDGDELLFEPPAETPQPKRETEPRVYRSAASLREERDRLEVKRRPLLKPLVNDRAAAGGQAMGPRRTAKNAQREDSRLRRYVELTKRIDHLNHRILLAESREKKAGAA